MNSLQPGYILMRFDSSYAHCLLIDFKNEFCDNCFLKKSSGLKQCSNCKFMHYCSVSCQRHDWQKCHKYECKLFGNVEKRSILNNDMLRIYIRLLTRYLNKDSASSDSIGLKSFDYLIDHYEDIKSDPDRMRVFYSLTDTLKTVMGTDFIALFKIEQLISFFGKMVINTFSISNENEGNIGTGIYLSGSSLNHSCDPNCAITFNGSQMLIKVIRTFSLESEQASISYTDMILSRKQRSDYLLQNYYFKCKCVRCLLPEDLRLTSIKCTQCSTYSIQIIDNRIISKCENDCQSFEADQTEMLKQIESVLKETNSKTLPFRLESSALKWPLKKSKLIERVQNLIQQSELLFDGLLARNEKDFSRNVYVIKLYELAFDLFIQSNQFDKAYLIATNKLINVYNLYLTKYHPTKELLLVKIIKLSLYLEKLDNIGVFLKEAQTIVKSNREPNSTLYQEFQEMACQLSSFI